MGTKKTQKQMPLIPLRGLSVFPHMVLHFDVGREKSIKALEEAMLKDQLIFLSTQKDIDVDLPTSADYYNVGTVSKIKQMLKLPGDAIRVLVEGVDRAEIVSIDQDNPFISATVNVFESDSDEVTRESEAFMRAIITAFETYISMSNRISPDVIVSIASIEEPSRFADVVSSHLVLKIPQKQEILEAIDVVERLELIYELILKEVEILEVEKDINEKVKSQINRLQKEYYLKEQLKAIKKELGDENDFDEEVIAFKEQLAKLKISKDIKEKIEKEIDRYSKMSPSSAESGVIRTYINWILSLPWNKQTKDKIDIALSREILDEDHYGLKDVKERVLEYLAIRQMTKSLKGPIICLVGPPGVGKTSIAKSIARSLGRKFTRMSLGGVRDEAEIRGHRRTYIGAIPGRIISGVKETGVNNPVFLFDEIDKLASDFRGDPASALLEVLDPAQNNSFMDHYLEVPFDLSNVMFVTTANSLSTIPRPLLDRMEVIQITGYTEFEKLKIAERYLVPKQMKEHGLTSDTFKLSKETLKEVINGYTREAGVRDLERKVGTVCRKAVTRIVEKKVKSVSVSRQNLHQFLGPVRFRDDEMSKIDEVGVVTGLAWTSVGGTTLQIEVTPMRGTGKLQLTGQMGDVMKESAQAGISYIRSRAELFGIDEDFHKVKDIHIHIPEGATPKDGPSAGITMATAVTSALTGIPVDHHVAMTGEITLRGRVLPIGGLKEKVLAAARVGITTIILPHDNEKDIEKIPSEVRKKLTFYPVKHMDEVLKIALTAPIMKDEKNED
ncbi:MULTISPECIES: endopeptidase La [unclassified Fusibacter]|uniref:endopeptidase La n=1 Tax=unclassified Fusibacter TaxID=2624464 RepID=UPI001011844B|nr:MULTISPECIES: endopeptidase La [unclassified Fusibacter]MCK8061654.1 endopeptidase La [Fusibacter sp. A2]NPE23838.1 endopeptidase La [Fusibacter sp. A1]RXV58611.1 endopeptidase La [Fusibacter sp. A1]